MQRFYVLGVLALQIHLVAAARGHGASHPPDAAVRAIQFFDEREGWAAGDDGVIWHSIDGGKTWELQASGVNASLRSIHFLTPYTGWIVGRVELPGGGSRGVVLATSDGGLKWAPIARQLLPGLNCIKFFNQRDGIAAGDGSDGFPSGIFITNDGGQTWKPVPGKRCPSWLTADFNDMETGALGGPWSHLATFRDGLVGTADVDPVGGRSIKGLKLQGRFAVAVGQGSLILTSSNSAGLKWGFAVPNLPKDVAAACDFEAVALNKSHIWVAGRPGTFVMHSSDRGQTWEMQKTGQCLPLHGIYFLDESTGWATGAMGTILRTTDGGKTWIVAQQGSQRAAALLVSISGETIPFEAAALLGEDDGYQTVGLRLTCAAAPAPPARNPDDDRLQGRAVEPTGSPPRLALHPEKLNAAMRLVGGAAGESLWQFPVPGSLEGAAPAELTAYWDRLHGERSSIELLRQLTLAIRIWRPEIIITDPVQAKSSGERILLEAIKEAFKLAADEHAFPEQLTTLRLSTWAPKKLYALLREADPAAVKLPLDEVRPRLADCARDYAQPAMLLLGQGKAAAEYGYAQLIASRLAGAVGDSHLMQGIDLAYGGQARRDLPPLDEKAVLGKAAIEKAVQKRRTIEKLIQGEGAQLASADKVLAQVGPALKEMPDDLGARAAFAIAQQYARAGQWVYAREAFLLMADRYPKHPLSVEAYRWLVQFQSSSEARRRQELGHFAVITETAVQRPDPEKQKGVIKGGTEIVQANQLVYLRDGEDARQWFQGSLAIEPRLQPLGAMYANDPAINLCLQSARRQLGDPEMPKKWFSRYLSEGAVPLGGQTVVRGADPWRDCAMAELWLLNRSIGTTPAKPLAYCPSVESRPHLDGKLEDACWQGVQPMVLQTATGELDTMLKKDEKGKLSPEYTAQAWLAHDRDYLYIAVRCTHPLGQRVAPVPSRGRDMDLRSHDRVSILLDLDRDYQTYFQLQIDQRGCLAEDCWGDNRWDPEWYVAIDSNDTTWTAEAAIPLKQIISAAPAAGSTWAANVVRTVPGKGVQAWSTPADTTPRPEGMGLLQFIQGIKR